MKFKMADSKTMITVVVPEVKSNYIDLDVFY